MAGVHSTRQFHSEVSIICTAFESLSNWVGNESADVENVQVPLIARLRELLDQADKFVGPDEVQS